MIPFYEPLSPNPPLLRWNLNTSQTKEQKRRSDWCEIHTLMRRSDWCEQHTTICTLTQMLFLFKKKKKKLKNEAEISTRAFPLESPSKKPAIILKTLTGKLFETRLMSSAQAWSMEKKHVCVGETGIGSRQQVCPGNYRIKLSLDSITSFDCSTSHLQRQPCQCFLHEQLWEISPNHKKVVTISLSADWK